MSDIFLSYDREDSARAHIIAQALERKGYSVWWDRVIPAGKTWDEVIEKNLRDAKVVVVLWSKESIKSDWVKEEAEEGRRILVPILIDDVKPPLGFRRIQAANLIDWKGTQDHPGFGLLLQSISGILSFSRGNEGENIATGGNAILAKVVEEKTFTNSIGMKLTLIPAGKFKMGSNEYDDEKPVHEVTIGSRFYLGMYQVTQKEWKAVMGNDPSYFKGDNLPVENVSWNDVQKFIKKLNKNEVAEKYRLPSEAEWEYAARTGTSTRYFFGDDESKLGDYVWFDDNSDRKTHEVGQKKPNPWGLYDMQGNVWEWVQDKWHRSYDGAPADGSSWESGDGSDRVVRGGSWNGNARYCRSAHRNTFVAGNRYGALGFRLLRIL